MAGLIVKTLNQFGYKAVARGTNVDVAMPSGGKYQIEVKRLS